MKTSSTKSATTASKSAAPGKSKSTSEPVEKKSATTATKAVATKQAETHKSAEMANTPTEKTTKAQTETSAPRFEPAVISHERIAEKAFELWLQRGCAHGYDVEDWLLAEQQIKAV